MKNASFEISLDTNQTEFPRGKRAELNVFDNYAGLRFNPSYIITKSHKEGDITVIDEFELTDVSIEQEDK